MWLLTIFYSDGPAKQSFLHSQTAFTLFFKAYLCEIQRTKADQIDPVSPQVNRKHQTMSILDKAQIQGTVTSPL